MPSLPLSTIDWLARLSSLRSCFSSNNSRARARTKNRAVLADRAVIISHAIHFSIAAYRLRYMSAGTARLNNARVLGSGMKRTLSM
jgi:hypothetical protein